MSSLTVVSTLDWPLLAGPCGDDGPDGVTAQQWESAQQTAVNWLWALSGRQYGTRVVTFRPEWTHPVAVPRAPWGSRGPWASPWLSSSLTMLPFGCAQARPSPVPGNRAPLPGPVDSLIQVLIDGAALDTDAYMQQGDDLVRIDGGTWPVSQDTTLPSTAAGTWEITYTRGMPVPEEGQQAAGTLACQLAARLLGRDCDLPANTTSVTRNGVTVSLDAVAHGFTNIASVDQWARSVNPGGPTQQASAVWSPDVDAALLPNPIRP